MIKLPLKPLTLLAIPLALCATLNAATTTDPVGVVKITIEAAPSEGSTKLTAISATLSNSTAYQGTATSIEAFSADSQPLETGVATWSATEWTAEPHLCYIENTAGAEEAYLITANDTDGTLTLATTFDLNSRYTSSPNYRICKAQTLSGIFSNLSTPFDSADRVYVWDGAQWLTYYHSGTWKISTDIFGNADDTVIFPDEGLFISRTQTSDITVTLNGSVPTKSQISTIANASFISNSFPVGTTLANSGLNDANWTTSDRVYIWDGAQWLTYYHNGTWKLTTDIFGNADATPISPDSAMFIVRASSIPSATADITQPVPYTP